tara:strand:- start:102 stop:341 length:240 start_codon:yes stop_codon:yes gene_type:complete
MPMIQETNKAKFIRLVEKRVNKVINSMRLVGNLANRSNYSYTEDDAKRVIDAIEGELKILKRRFEASGEKEKQEFKLKP